MVERQDRQGSSCARVISPVDLYVRVEEAAGLRERLVNPCMRTNARLVTVLARRCVCVTAGKSCGKK